MRPRGSAGDRRFLSDVRVDQVTRPEDPRVADLVRLLNQTFPDPNSVLGLDRIQQFLSDNSTGAPRQFHVLLAERPNTFTKKSASLQRRIAGTSQGGGHNGFGLVGASIFSYVAGSNCGFSEYLLVEPALRRQGLGRILFDRRQAVLNADAVRHGQPACNGVFIEVDSPWRTPAELLAAESFDPLERLRVFAHLGFRRVAVAYVQPPLGADKSAVEHMDLLFAPWAPETLASDSIPAEWALATLETIWSAWTPELAGSYLVQLRGQIHGPSVSLVDPLVA